MKLLKKNIIAGIGRALGLILVYGILALTIKLAGISIDFSTLPPTISGEITSSLTNKNN